MTRRKGKDKVRLWVSPGFKKMLKQTALNENMDVISLTEKLAKIDPIKAQEEIFEPITKFMKRIL